MPKSSTEVVVNTALLARIEVLEAENAQLKSEPRKAYFRLEDIEHDDNLVRFYTGFVSFAIFIAFFEFLGPFVNHLNYWGSKECIRKRQRKRKLDPKNQLFLTLVKLKLNLKVKDLGFCFGLSMSQVSRYITTWICFLYHHLKEIDWIPTVEQVKGTLPSSFHDKFPTTYAIIDGSEILLRHLLTCKYSHLPGASINTIILPNFWLLVLLMDLLLTYLLSMLALSQMLT